MQHYQREHLGTLLSIQVDTPHEIWGVFLEIEKYVEAFEQKYSRFRPGNWLDELNRTGVWILDEDGYVMISYSLKIAQQSGGVFDPTILPRLEAIGYGLERSSKNIVGYDGIKIDAERISLSPWVRIELGGIGKWYLIDRLKEILDSHEYNRFLIDFGGDIFARGEWQVWLEHPLDSDYILQVITLTDEALAGSSGEKRKIGAHAHIIHPKEDQYPSLHHAVFVRSDTALQADVHATLCYLLSREAIQAYVEEYAEGIREIYLV